MEGGSTTATAFNQMSEDKRSSPGIPTPVALSHQRAPLQAATCQPSTATFHSAHLELLAFVFEPLPLEIEFPHTFSCCRALTGFVSPGRQ